MTVGSLKFTPQLIAMRIYKFFMFVEIVAYEFKVFFSLAYKSFVMFF